MKRSYAAAALILCLFPAGALLSANPLAVNPGPRGGPYPGFEVRYGIAPTTGTGGLAGLLDKPTLVDSRVRTFTDEAAKGKVVEAMGDAHAVYDIPMAALIAVLEVDPNHVKTGAGILEARVDLKEGPRAVVYQELGTTFLGITISFKTRSEIYRDELPDGAVGFRAHLTESLDGKIYESFSSWYLVPVTIDGRQLVYIRTFMRSGLRNPFLGEESILRAFIPVQSTELLATSLKQARKRMR